MLVKVLVINVADSIFDVDLLIPLLNDMTSAAEKETVPITHRLLGLEDLWFQKWNWHVKIAHVTEFQVSLTFIMIFMVGFQTDINIMGTNKQTLW